MNSVAETAYGSTACGVKSIEAAKRTFVSPRPSDFSVWLALYKSEGVRGLHGEVLFPSSFSAHASLVRIRQSKAHARIPCLLRCTIQSTSARHACLSIVVLECLGCMLDGRNESAGV